MNTNFTFSGHESFPCKSLWLKKGYDFNKANMAQIQPYDAIASNRLCAKTVEDIWQTIGEDDYSYWMLLCRERNDYTVFRLEIDLGDFESAFVECLANRGKVLDITKQKDGNYEIWIRDVDTNENFVYYFFNYTNAVVEV